MTNQLSRLKIRHGVDEFWQPKFRGVLEDHLTWLRDHNGTRVIEVKIENAVKYNFDFYGLLATLGVEMKYFWTNLRLNGYSRPEEYRSVNTQILIADEAAIEGLRSRFMTNRK